MKVVYLLHFDRPYKGKAQHYMGSTDNLERRVSEHVTGHGSPLVAAAVQDGIRVTVARTWEGGRQLERQLKGKSAGSQGLDLRCPICRPFALSRRNELRRLRYRLDPEAHKASNRKNYHENREERRRTQAVYWQANKDRINAKRRKVQTSKEGN